MYGDFTGARLSFISPFAPYLTVPGSPPSLPGYSKELQPLTIPSLADLRPSTTSNPRRVESQLVKVKESRLTFYVL